MPAPDDMQRVRRLPAKIDGKKGDTSNEEELSPSELQRHARDAVQNYNKAIELDRKQGLFFLSLGSFLEFASAQSSRCWSAPLNIPTDIDEKAKDAGTLMVQDILSGKGEAHEAERIIVTSTWDWSAHQYRSLIAALQHAQFTQDRKQRLEIRSLLDLHWKQATED
jgi:hypothetical protein